MKFFLIVLFFAVTSNAQQALNFRRVFKVHQIINVYLKNKNKLTIINNNIYLYNKENRFTIVKMLLMNNENNVQIFIEKDHLHRYRPPTCICNYIISKDSGVTIKDCDFSRINLDSDAIGKMTFIPDSSLFCIIRLFVDLNLHAVRIGQDYFFYPLYHPFDRRGKVSRFYSGIFITKKIGLIEYAKKIDDDTYILDD
jgi:hypothetical protein